MYIKTNENTYNEIHKNILNKSKEFDNFNIGFLKESLIGELLDYEKYNNKSINIVIDNTIDENKIIFTEESGEEIFLAYLCDFLKCMVVNNLSK